MSHERCECHDCVHIRLKGQFYRPARFTVTREAQLAIELQNAHAQNVNLQVALGEARAEAKEAKEARNKALKLLKDMSDIADSHRICAEEAGKKLAPVIGQAGMGHSTNWLAGEVVKALSTARLKCDDLEAALATAQKERDELKEQVDRYRETARILSRR